VNLYGYVYNQPFNYVDDTGGKPIPMIGDDLRRAQEQGGFFGLMGATPAAIWNLMNPFDPTSPASMGRQKFNSEMLPRALANLDAMNVPSSLKTLIKLNIGFGIAGNSLNPLNGAVGLYDTGTTVARIGPVATGKQILKSIHDQPAVFAGALPLMFVGGRGFFSTESLGEVAAVEEVAADANAETGLMVHPFSGGGTHITTSVRLAAHAESPTFGGANGLFLAPTRQIDKLLASGASRSQIEIALGLDEGALAQGTLMRIDVANPFARNLSLPTSGNIFFRPGTGMTWGGLNEGIITSPLKTDSGVLLQPVSGL
jgi:hypothetical protein